LTPEQRALVKKADQSPEAARLLQRHGQSSFAAARAYYTMFYLAEALLLGEGLAFSKHTAVQAAFGERFAKTGRAPVELHRYLIRGLEVRHLADYATSPVSKEEADEQIARAERFLAFAREALAHSQEGRETESP
jgi:uncharacterized protein (UPF0332 family)